MGRNGRPQIGDARKEMTETMFYEDTWISLRIAASQVRLHHMTLLNFLKQDSKLYLCDLQKHQEMNDLNNQNRIRFVRYQ